MPPFGERVAYLRDCGGQPGGEGRLTDREVARGDQRGIVVVGRRYSGEYQWSRSQNARAVPQGRQETGGRSHGGARDRARREAEEDFGDGRGASALTVRHDSVEGS